MTRRQVAQVDRTELRYGELDRDVAVEAVLRLAVSGSLETITMRALAAELGTSPAALYYHVRDRNDLMNLATETVLGRVRIPSTDLPWDSQLRTLFLNARQVMLPVTGIAAVLQTRGVSPSARQLDQTANSILISAGFGQAAARAGKMALSTFLLGAVAVEQIISAADPADLPVDSISVFRSRDFTAGLEIIIAGLKYRREQA